jgi:hypothetical protein
MDNKTKVSVVVTRKSGDSEWFTLAELADLPAAHAIQKAIMAAAKQLIAAPSTLEGKRRATPARSGKQVQAWDTTLKGSKTAKRLRRSKA